MKATLKDNRLLIELELVKPPRPSGTGKTLIVATSGGFAATEAVIDGQPVMLSVNATIRKAS
jgi:hypothetical protein